MTSHFKHLSPVWGVSLLTLVSQVLTIATQVIAASLFGASVSMDAYVAASAAPQYLIAVLLGAVSAVAVPWLTDFEPDSDDESAGRAAGHVLAWLGGSVGLISLVAAIFAEPILRVTASGLSESHLHMSVTMAKVSWPVAPCLCVAGFLTGLAQVKGRFWYATAAVVVAAIVGLLTTVLLPNWVGANALAWSTTLSGIAQVVFLWPVAQNMPGFRLILFPIRDEARKLFHLAMPLLLTGLLIRSMPLVDRWFASLFPAGTLSHLNYAYKIVTILSALLATGVSTVAFPDISRRVAANDLEGLTDSISKSLRSIWVLVLPVAAIGIGVSLSGVKTVFERGEFGADDSLRVAQFLQIYLIALIGMAVGTLTSRILYSFKRTRLLSGVSILESLAYIGYAWLLVRWFGPIGIALSSVALFLISPIWHLAVSHKIAPVPSEAFRKLVLVAMIAAAAGGVAWFCAQMPFSPPISLLSGLVFGTGLYWVGLHVLARSELALLKFPRRQRAALPTAPQSDHAESRI